MPVASAATVPDLLENGLDALDLFRNKKEIPDPLALYLCERVAGDPLAGVVEPDDAAVWVEHDHQGAQGFQDRLDEIALFAQRGFHAPLLAEVFAQGHQARAFARLDQPGVDPDGGNLAARADVLDLQAPCEPLFDAGRKRGGVSPAVVFRGPFQN